MTTLEKLKQVQHDFHHAVSIMRNIADGYGWSKIVENCEKSVSLIPSIIEEVDALQRAKDMAYWERNRLVALIARIYSSGRAVTNIPGWDDKWHNCIYIDTPRGQLSWHVHDNEMVQFASLPEYENDWDGHNTDEKYRRLLLLLLDLESKRVTKPTEDA